MLEKSILKEYTPWELGTEFKPSILFGMAKQHKRAKDPMAYRFITSACSDISKPLSDEALRILTFLWNKAKSDCSKLKDIHNAKFFWSIDSLDIVPLNIDITECRPNRQPSAFDIEKCFECIPLFDSEHSLISRISVFLDLVWEPDALLSSDWHPYKPGPKDECFWSSEYADLSYDKARIIDLCKEVMNHAVVTVGNCAAKQTVGIPMGFSVSVMFLNLFMFTYEFEFTMRLVKNSRKLAQCTNEFFRYVDDLGNFSDKDIRPYLKKMHSKPTDWSWIYPMAPWGPLSITDQTERSESKTCVTYLNLEFVLIKGILAYSWHDKISTYKKLGLPTCSYTHWTSSLSAGSKLGTIKSQVRAIIIASSSLESCQISLQTLLSKFVSIGYPIHLTRSTIETAFKLLLPSMPVPYTPTPGVLVNSRDGKGGSLSLSLSISIHL